MPTIQIEYGDTDAVAFGGQTFQGPDAPRQLARWLMREGSNAATLMHISMGSPGSQATISATLDWWAACPLQPGR